MIYDHITRIDKYATLSPLMAKAIEFVKATDLAKLTVGQHDVAGEDIFAAVHEYDSKAIDACNFEGHRKYVDLQIIVSGVERMDVVDIDGLTVKHEYDEKKDFAFFNRPAQVQTLIVSACEFAIFQPHDVHAPSIAADKPTAVKKVVLKIKAW